MAISCDSCGRYLRGCSSNDDCTETHDEKANNRKKVCTRLETGVINCKKGELDVERLLSAIPLSRIIAKERLVRHKNLNLPSATETNLAIAFGQNRFFLASALETTKSLRNATGKKILDKVEKFRRCFKPLQKMNEMSSEMLAGGIEEANELRRRHNQEKYL